MLALKIIEKCIFLKHGEQTEGANKRDTYTYIYCEHSISKPFVCFI